jgi:hypothetical protein
MTKVELFDMKGGWFIGDFEPAILRSKEFECGMKKYDAGHIEDSHVHKQATEITLITDGVCTINDVIFASQDICVLEPGDIAKFIAITNCTTVVIKVPSIPGDKFLTEEMK